MFEFALEVLKGGKVPVDNSEQTRQEIEKWRKGLLETIEMASEADIVGLKWSGLGVRALDLLKRNQSPTPQMESAIQEVCDAAAKKRVGLFPGAEEEVTNVGIDNWTMNLQDKYNRLPSPPSNMDEEKGHATGSPATIGLGGKAIMFTTYQAYLRSTPKNLARHLAAAKVNGHVLGVKLVRGAYLGSESKSQVWSSKEETDRVYDSLAESLLQRRYSGLLQPLHGTGCSEFPKVDLVLATHNVTSVRKALAIRQEQLDNREEQVPTAFIQLMGMADDVSCELLAAGRAAEAANSNGALRDVPKAMKCATWGTLTECLHFLLRRAAENKDAMGRTVDSRKAMGAELWRRCKAMVGLA